MTLPFDDVRRLVITHDQPDDVWSFGIDNIQFETTPLTLTFAITNQTPEAERRVLTHKYRTDDAYPSSHQTKDGAVKIRGTVKAGEQPRAGVKVYFRLLDPPDTAAYVVRAGDQKDDDNYDPEGGKLTETEAVSGVEGIVETELKITSFAAGDNYRIEASFNDEFECAGEGTCPRSGMLTVWKRVYVEVNKMFRKGTYVRRQVLPGAKEIPVWDVQNLPDPPFTVRLVHAAPVIGATAEFYSEVVEIVEIEKQDRMPPVNLPGILKLDSDPAVPGVSKTYVGGEVVGTLTADPRPYLADAVGIVTGNRGADYFVPNGTLVNRTFSEAFVEHVWLTDAVEGVDPDLDATQTRLFYDGVIPFTHTVDKPPDLWQTEWLTRKWMRHARRSGQNRTSDSNHQIVFTGSRHAFFHGLNRVGDGFNDLWLFVGQLKNRALIGEAFVHELAHEWRVNRTALGANVGGHCNFSIGTDQMMYNRPLKCAMTSHLYGDPMNAERNDGIVGFHYVRIGDRRDSEYLFIRRRAEPIPQSDDDRPEPK